MLLNVDPVVSFTGCRISLVLLSKLADAHSIEEFRDPTTIAHIQLVDIVHRIAREAWVRPLDE